MLMIYIRTLKIAAITNRIIDFLYVYDWTCDNVSKCVHEGPAKIIEFSFEKTGSTTSLYFFFRAHTPKITKVKLNAAKASEDKADGNNGIRPSTLLIQSPRWVLIICLHKVVKINHVLIVYLHWVNYCSLRNKHKCQYYYTVYNVSNL